jgi:prepilin-type processing-associated H-X9-DG protein
MEVAHWMYATANNGYMVKAGLAHGGAHAREDVAWINTLQPYYSDALMVRCPADDSPHWPDNGQPIPPSTDVFRRCSYGINEFTDPDLRPWGPVYLRIEQIPDPASTVHFLEMAEQGSFAGADHPHVDLWVGNVLAKASTHLQINQHGGELRTPDARANYGFLDGHAQTLPFEDVFTDRSTNNFDPAVAK